MQSIGALLRKTMVWNRLGHVGLAIDNAVWLSASHLLRWIAALFGGILVARYLGPEQFGWYRYALATVTVFIPLWTLGLTSILSKEIIVHPNQQNLILGTALLLRCLAGILGSVLVISGAVLLTEGDPPIALYIGILSIGGCVSCLEAFRSWFDIRAAARQVVPIQLIITYASAAAKGLLVLANAPLLLFVIVGSIDLATAGISIFLAFLHQRQKVRELRFQGDMARQLLRQSWPLVLSGVASAIYLKIDQLMLGWMVSYTASGIYAVAVTLSEMWYILATVLTASVYPFLVRLKHNNPDGYRLRLQQLYDLLFIASVFLALFVTIIAHPVIELLYGVPFEGAAPVLMVHIWAAVFMFARELFSKWLIMENLFMYSLLTDLSGATLNIILNFFLIPYAHEIGAAVATVISYAVAGPVSALLFPRTRDAGQMMARSFTAPLRLAIGPRQYLLSFRSGSANPRIG